MDAIQITQHILFPLRQRLENLPVGVYATDRQMPVTAEEPFRAALNKTVGAAWKAKGLPYLCHGRVILLGNKVSKKSEAIEPDDRGHHQIAVRIKEKPPKNASWLSSQESPKVLRPKGNSKQNQKPLGVPGEEWLVFSSRQVS